MADPTDPGELDPTIRTLVAQYLEIVKEMTDLGIDIPGQQAQPNQSPFAKGTADVPSNRLFVPNENARANDLPPGVRTFGPRSGGGFIFGGGSPFPVDFTGQRIQAGTGLVNNAIQALLAMKRRKEEGQARPDVQLRDPGVRERSEFGSSFDLPK